MSTTLPRKRARARYKIDELLHLNLIGDGICDMVSGVVGGPAGTNYGENISTMAITKVFSSAVMVAAAIIAMVVSFFTPLVQAIYAIPTAVIGGLEIYLFGAIAAQGIAIMIDKKADMFSSKNLAVIACIMIIALGGQYAFGGNINFFGLQVPCIAGAAITGILLNLILSIGEKKEKDRRRSQGNDAVSNHPSYTATHPRRTAGVFMICIQFSVQHPSWRCRARAGRYRRTRG